MKKYLVTLYTKGMFGNKTIIFDAHRFITNSLSGDVVFLNDQGINVGLVSRSLIESITIIKEEA